MYRDANEYLIQIEDTKNSDWKDLDLALSRTFQFNVSQIYRAELPWSQCCGQRVTTKILYTGLYLPCYFCPPLLCPFTLAKNFDLSLYCPDKADTNTVIQKLFWIRLVLSSPTENEGERSIYNMGMNIFLYTAILFIK